MPPPKPNHQMPLRLPRRKAVEADLGTRKQALITESGDLESIEKSLRGYDVDNALTIDQRATYGVMYLDASFWFLGEYDRMQCDEDKKLAKVVLQNRLEFYAHMLDMAVNDTDGFLGLTRVPAVAQQGAKIRDELRAAKLKLDEIDASLK